jgi:hypothetical protein
VSNVPMAQKSCWTHPMELLGEWVMWNLVSICLETDSVHAIYVHGLRRTYHRLQKSFWTHPTILQGDRVGLEIVLILTQDGCVVCAKRTIGSEIVLNAPDGSPR